MMWGATVPGVLRSFLDIFTWYDWSASQEMPLYIPYAYQFLVTPPSAPAFECLKIFLLSLHVRKDFLWCFKDIPPGSLPADFSWKPNAMLFSVPFHTGIIYFAHL